MLTLIKGGQKKIRVSADIFSSPTYSRDVAAAMKTVIDSEPLSGLFHVANSGKASLFELMQEVVHNLGLDAEVEQASYNDFPYIGRKNINTPICSVKIPALRPWKDAVKEYCDRMKKTM